MHNGASCEVETCFRSRLERFKLLSACPCVVVPAERAFAASTASSDLRRVSCLCSHGSFTSSTSSAPFHAVAAALCPPRSICKQDLP